MDQFNEDIKIVYSDGKSISLEELDKQIKEQVEKKATDKIEKKKKDTIDDKTDG